MSDTRGPCWWSTTSRRSPTWGRYLARAGYETRVAGDGPRAIQLAGERRRDLVVLDLMLPGIDGLEVMRRLRDLGDTDGASAWP